MRLMQVASFAEVSEVYRNGALDKTLMDRDRPRQVALPASAKESDRLGAGDATQLLSSERL